jgi:hypothetical protein
MSGKKCAAVISYGDLSVEVEADGLYSPDGVHDLVGQVIRGFNEALAYIKVHGMMDLVDPDDEDDDDEDDPET